MKQLVVVFLVLLLTLSCARHFVVERDRGRMDGDKSITSMSDVEWTIHEEPGEEEP